jgi:uncharacterized membrane protein
MAEREEQAKEAVSEAKDKVTGGGGNGSLKKIVGPAAAGVGGLAATYAARKATDALKERMSTDGGGDTSGKTRRLPIQRWTDVAAPIEVVYEHWTQFEDFPKFMHRVLNVDAKGRNKVSWDEKIWFSRRHWEGEITERRKNDRIAWKTTTGTSHSGVVTFHSLDTNLTRVMVDMDFHPSGMLEKMASGLRFVKRAVEADLARFKAYVELGEAKGLEYKHEPDEAGDAEEASPKEKAGV